VVASYYDLFAILGGSSRALYSELLGTAAFVALAAIGFSATSGWWRSVWSGMDGSTSSTGV